MQPASSPAKMAESATPTSYYADDPPAESDLTTSAAEAPAAFRTSASTISNTTTSSASTGMPNGAFSCFGDCRNRCWQPFVGIEAVLLAPVTNKGGGGDSYAFNTGLLGATGTTYNASSVNGMIVTPRIWAGVMGECWGVGVRYWRFSNTSGGETATLGPTSSIFQQGALKLQTFDLEAIRRFCCCGNQCWVTFGARYAQFNRNSTIQAENSYAGSIYTGAASSGAGFNGVGPTVAIYGLKPIGCSCWNLFYSARGSYLFDNNSTAFAQTNATFLNGGTGASATAQNVASGSGNGNAWIGELQLGVQYNHVMTCFPGTAFLRIAGEYQYWHTNSTAANSTSGVGFVTGPTTATAITAANAGNSTLGLLGFGIATGFMW